MSSITISPLKKKLYCLLTFSALAAGNVAVAQVRLADQPVFSSNGVPGNMALALSVEFPTAISVAHSSRTYSSANNYLGYFDPAKCYRYQWVSDTANDTYRYIAGTSDDNYFYPTRAATDRKCNGEWSGNFLNWAAMQTIDPFRWALTGGYRWIDTPTLTVLEKAWSPSSQGSANSNFQDSTTTGAEIAGATPFTGAATLGTYVWGQGNKMRFMAMANGSPSKTGTATQFQGTATLGTLYEVFVRVKVCDNTVGREDNCVAYGRNYKPEGLMQQYSDKIRYSAFGYLASNADNDAQLKRDGAVLRAAQRFIGPTQPVPGSNDITNPLTPEWDASTGVMARNPNSADATASSTENVPIVDSGVMNYLNKFGEINRTVYKRFDPVSELYYAALRYFRNLGNVPAWSSLTGSTDAARKTAMDGFPVITNWTDPIQYSCQRNFILGIGDVNTHADRNLPGATTGTKEPAMPTEVFDDPVNAVEWTNRVGVLQGLGATLGATTIGGNEAGYLMAGLAYYANTTDIRADLVGNQNVKTYWLDVLESGYQANRQFYLAAKYGGFNPPTDYKVATATATDFANNKGWWTTTGETIGGQDKPDNFFTANRPDLMVNGLRAAFSSISSQLKAFSTSFSTPSPQVASTGVASYAASYDAENWTGDVQASETSFDGTGKPSPSLRWSLSSKLNTQAAGTGWNSDRFIVTRKAGTRSGVPFRIADLADSQIAALNTSYVAGDDSSNYLNYLRGDRTRERAKMTDKALGYRDRVALLGDVIGAKTKPVGPPAAPYSDAANPGYSTFKTTHASRRTMVYVGSNDGMLHAVDGALSGDTAGREVWAYVPSALFSGPSGTPNVNGLAALGNPDFTHRNFVDATPLTADVDFGSTVGGGSGTDWRSILVGGLGKGGKMIYALDITTPSDIANEPAATRESKAATKVLWEFTDEHLGYVYGQPIMVKTRKYGWTVIVGSGYNNADGKGYIFFINPRNGALLQKVATACDACSVSNEAGLAHVNAFIVNQTDGYADAVYAGDLKGQLWRVDISGTDDYPAAVKLAQLTGSDNQALPVTSSPLIAIQPGTNRRYVTVGTGKLLSDADISSTQPQRFFAILDGNNARTSTTSDLPTGVTFPLAVSNLRQITNLTTPISLDQATQMGWYLDLGSLASGPGWRVLLDPAYYNGIVAFAATAPSSADACKPGGTSRVYAIDLGTGSSVLEDTDGTLKSYDETLTGVVIDLGFYNVTDGTGSGKPNPVTCDTLGNCTSPKFRDKGGRGIQRLNWREIYVNN